MAIIDNINIAPDPVVQVVWSGGGRVQGPFQTVIAGTVQPQDMVA